MGSISDMIELLEKAKIVVRNGKRYYADGKNQGKEVGTIRGKGKKPMPEIGVGGQEEKKESFSGFHGHAEDFHNAMGGQGKPEDVSKKLNIDHDKMTEMHNDAKKEAFNEARESGSGSEGYKESYKNKMHDKIMNHKLENPETVSDEEMDAVLNHGKDKASAESSAKIKERQAAADAEQAKKEESKPEEAPKDEEKKPEAGSHEDQLSQAGFDGKEIDSIMNGEEVNVEGELQGSRTDGLNNFKDDYKQKILDHILDNKKKGIFESGYKYLDLPEGWLEKNGFEKVGETEKQFGRPNEIWYNKEKDVTLQHGAYSGLVGNDKGARDLHNQIMKEAEYIKDASPYQDGLSETTPELHEKTKKDFEGKKTEEKPEDKKEVSHDYAKHAKSIKDNTKKAWKDSKYTHKDEWAAAESSPENQKIAEELGLDASHIGKIHHDASWEEYESRGSKKYEDIMKDKLAEAVNWNKKKEEIGQVLSEVDHKNISDEHANKLAELYDTDAKTVKESSKKANDRSENMTELTNDEVKDYHNRWLGIEISRSKSKAAKSKKSDKTKKSDTNVPTLVKSKSNIDDLIVARDKQITW